MVKSAPAMARVKPPLSVYLDAYQHRCGLLAMDHLRVESVFPQLSIGSLRSVGEGVARAVQYGILTEQAGHRERAERIQTGRSCVVPVFLAEGDLIEIVVGWKIVTVSWWSFCSWVVRARVQLQPCPGM